MFVEGFSSISASWKKLIHKETKLTIAPILIPLVGNDGYVVCFDASRIFLGCVLMQHGKVIAYIARHLGKHLQN